MTREEFKPMAKTLKIAYQKDNFLSDKDSLNLWYYMLKDLDAKVVFDAVSKYIKTKTFQPTIADIRNLCEEELNKYSKCRSEMREIFDYTRGFYPAYCQIEKDTMEYWNKMTAADTWEDRITKARWLSNKIIDYVHMCELTGKINDMPTFTERLRELADELRS